MSTKIIETGVVLLCLALSFGWSADTFPASDSLLDLKAAIKYRLPNDTTPEAYNISLWTGISEGRFGFDGLITIDLLVVNATRKVTIHSRKLNIKFVRLSNATGTIDLLPWRNNAANDFLIIPTKSDELAPGSRYQLDLKFAGKLQQRSRGFFRRPSDKYSTNKRWIAITHFQPSGARLAFPCYDEPALKANVTIGITHGASYSAISNMPASTSKNADGTATTRFETSPLMSTYLIAFAVTDFQFRANAASSRIPMRVYATAMNHENTRFALTEGEKILSTLENCLQVPYALPKMDQIFILRLGKAMENWGLITYGEETLVNETSSTFDQKMLSASIIAHEFTHQWFGDIVSPKWWSYTWLNEGFATFFQDMIVNLNIKTLYSQPVPSCDYISIGLATSNIHPEYEIVNRYVASTAVSFELDVYPQVRPMVQYAEEPDNIEELFDFVSYLKSACVIRMFWNAVSESSFKKGLTNYLRLNAYTAVDEDNLFEELDRAVKYDGTLESGLSMQEIFSSWTHQAGFPMLNVRRNYENGSITIFQERYTVNRFSRLVNASSWWIPYNFATAKSSSFNDTLPGGWLPPRQHTKLIEPKGLDGVWSSTDWVLFNKQWTGYYRVMYDAANWKLLTAELNTGSNNKIHPSSRAQLLDDMKSFVETGRLPKDALIEMVKYLKHETEYAPWVAGSKALLYLNKALAATDDYDTFRAEAVRIIDSFGKRFARRAGSKESISLAKTSQVVRELACRLSIGTCSNITGTEDDNSRLNQWTHLGLSVGFFL